MRSRFATSAAGGLFYVSSFTKVETTAELVQVALDEVARFAEGGPTAEELERMQNYLCGLFPLSLETHDQIAERLADLALYGLGDDQVTGFRERVRAVTAEDCRAVARRYFPGAGRWWWWWARPGRSRSRWRVSGRSGSSPRGRSRERASSPRPCSAQDAQLLVVNKPAGRLVIPGRGRDEPSLVEELSAVGTGGSGWSTGSTAAPPACWSSPGPPRRIAP